MTIVHRPRTLIDWLLRRKARTELHVSAETLRQTPCRGRHASIIVEDDIIAPRDGMPVPTAAEIARAIKHDFGARAKPATIVHLE